MRKALSVLLGAATLFGSSQAMAQDFGAQGDVSFAADRLMGFYLTLEPDCCDGTGLGLGIPGAAPFPYATPRLGVDFFVIDQLSLGFSLGFFSEDDDDEGPDDDDAFNGFMFHGRVGYAAAFSESFGIWPRGGITFSDVEDSDEVALTAEAMFYFDPVDNFGFIFGPTLDLGLAGDGEENVVVGLISAGVRGWL
jgi:hypothetical protein